MRNCMMHGMLDNIGFAKGLEKPINHSVSLKMPPHTLEKKYGIAKYTELS